MAVQAAPPQQQLQGQGEDEDQFGPQPVSKLEVRHVKLKEKETRKRVRSFFVTEPRH